MLMLTRKRSEMIRIGEDVFIKVIRTGKNTVKLGIEAPADVRILRAELAEESRPVVKGESLELGEEPGFNPPGGPCSDQFPHPQVA